MSEFLFRKDIDKSVLTQGFTIPLTCHQKLFDWLGFELEVGDKTPIYLTIGADVYDADIRNLGFNREKYKDRSEIIQVRYNPTDNIANMLNALFYKTKQTVDNYYKSRTDKSHVVIPEEEKEYIDIYLSNRPSKVKIIHLGIWQYDDIDWNDEKQTNEENIRNYIQSTERKVQLFDDNTIKTRAKKASKKKLAVYNINTKTFIRDPYVAEYVKRKANGICQLCGNPAPFKDSNNKPYLESHHIVWLSKGGEDTIENTVALCPNCHRKMHVLNSQEDIDILIKKVDQ